MVQLNFVGWSALLGTGLAFGAIVWLVTPLALLVALPIGVVVLWATLGALDYRRWRNAKTHTARDDLTDEAGAEIVARLEALGIHASYEVHEDDPEDGGEIYRGILFRNADESTVRRVMSEVLG